MTKRVSGLRLLRTRLRS